MDSVDSIGLVGGHKSHVQIGLWGHIFDFAQRRNWWEEKESGHDFLWGRKWHMSITKKQSITHYSFKQFPSLLSNTPLGCLHTKESFDGESDG